MDQLVEWKFDGGGWLQVYQAPDRAGRGSCTLSISDLDVEIERLRSNGLDVASPTVNPGMRVVMIQDGDGNSIALAESSDPTVAQ
ncbi:hypothetical protein BH23GEM9_BH23GEM9_17800 [soil metagenome]